MRPSIQAVIAYIATPSTASAMSEAKSSGTLKSALARAIRLPIPYFEALYSAITEPT